MTVRRVHDQTIHASVYQFVSAFLEISGRANRRRNSQTTKIILRCCRIFDRFLNVFDGNQTFQVLVAIDDEKFFDAMLLQDGFRLIERSANRNSYEGLLGHHFGNRQFEARLEAQVAIGDDTDQMSVSVNDRHAADVIALHHVQGFPNRTVLWNCHGIDDHSRFRSFDLVNFLGLALDAQVLVNNANAALLRDGDCQRSFRYGIHRGRAKRDLQANAARELR